MIVEQDVWMSTRDGVRLATDIYRPADGDRHPVLVHRGPYPKDDDAFTVGVILDVKATIERGYAIAVQQVRGRYGSEGEWEPVVHEAEDGYDAVEWAAAQPWSTGDVGIYGSSYLGFTTLQTLPTRPPHLRAAAALVTSPDLNQGVVRVDGAFQVGLASWWAGMMMVPDTIERLDVPESEKAGLRAALGHMTAHPWESIERLPLDEIEAFSRGAAAYWQTWIREKPDSGYWQAMNVVAQADRIDVPLLQVAGWYETFHTVQLDLHRRLQADPRHRIIIGPWDHQGAYGAVAGGSTAAGEREFGPAAESGATTFTPILLDWFDRWLRSDRPSDGGAPRVRYFQMGDDEWRTCETWPPATAETVLYLDSAGNANTLHGDGSLRTAVPGHPGIDIYRYDPRDPAPTVGGATIHYIYGNAGVYDQRAVEERPDVLVFTSDELTRPLQVCGRVTAELFVSSDAEDTDFTAKLVDVEPSAYAANIGDGIVRCRYRNGGSDDWLTPGRITEITVDIGDVAHTFLPGHRVRLELSSSNFPRYSRHLNGRGLPETGRAVDARVAEQRIWYGGEHVSRLRLQTTSEGA
ncbi:MAG TPA: CocE/NonD family hydrolase [Streptosporangiaceae bacterium]|jgi:hypothetical protein